MDSMKSNSVDFNKQRIEFIKEGNDGRVQNVLQTSDVIRTVDFDKHFLEFIKAGKNDRVKEILQNSDLFHAVDFSGSTLLHYCARFGNKTIAQFLLINNCNVNAQDSNGNTSLMIAVAENQQSVIMTLLAYGANVFLLNHEKQSVLHMLPKFTDLTLSFVIYQIFLNKFQKEYTTVEDLVDKLINEDIGVYSAAYFCDSNIIENLILRDYPVDSIHPVNKCTGLFVSVYFHDITSVKTFLKHNANLNAMDYQNASLLYYLYQDGSEYGPAKVEILKILLDLGVSPMHCNSHGYFDIVHILRRGNRDAIRVLLQSNKLDFTATDKIHGRTILHYLAQNTNPGIVEELEHCTDYDASCNVFALDNTKRSVLYFASSEGNAEMIQFLMDKEVEPWNEKAVFHAYTKSNPKFQDRYDRCIEILLQNNDDPQFFTGGPKPLTVFDLALQMNDFDRIKPFIAQLALIEKLGRYITEETLIGINSHHKFSEYFEKCQELISEEIFESVTLFELLTCDDNTMDQYLSNKQLLNEVELFIQKHEMESSHRYLFSTWQRRYSQGWSINNCQEATRTNWEAIDVD